MTKANMVEAILNDMIAKKSPYDNEDISKRWRGWLSKQSKATLTEIMINRGI